MTAHITPTFSAAPFISRRNRLAEKMQAAGGGVAVIPTAEEKLRNRDTPYPFRFDSHFHYLTGFHEPEAVLVLIAGHETRSVLFCRERDEGREIWDGYRFGPEQACEHFALDEARPIEQLDSALPDLLADQPILWFGLGRDNAWDRRITQALNDVRGRGRSGIRAPHSLCDAHALLDEMRVVKTTDEIALMRKAAEISAEAHSRAMRAARPDNFEYAVEAELLHTFRAAGSPGPAYPSIVASGPNACVLHYTENERRMRDGELLLIDAGCEIDGYAADITRTFPVNGHFSNAQREIYQLVLSAQHAAREQVRPGRDFNASHEAVLRVLSQGLIDLGLLQGSLEQVLEEGGYRRFFMHRTGHWLGRDVHDVGDYKIDGQWRTLEPGMVLTLEPGCYIRPADDIPEAFWNIGVRIEDDALVTAEGCEYLTDGVPREIDDIEALMREAQHGRT